MASGLMPLVYKEKLIKQKIEQMMKSQRNDKFEMNWSNLADVEGMRAGGQANKCGLPLGTAKAQRWILLWLPEGKQTCQCIAFSSVKPVLDF